MQSLILNPNGSVAGVNRARLYELPFFLCTNPPDNTVLVPALTAFPNLIAFSTSGEGPSILHALSADYQGNAPLTALVKFWLVDGKTRKALCNTALNIGTVFGSGAQPYPMPEPLYSDQLRRLIVEFSDLSGSDNPVRLVGHANRVTEEKLDTTCDEIKKQQDPKQFLKFPFFYTFDDGEVTLGANASTSIPITIDEDTHFLLKQISYVSTGRFSLNILDAIKGESIISAPGSTNYNLPADLILGDPHFPYEFSEPILFQLKQRLIVNLTDLSGQTNNIFITLGGCKLADRLWY
jgi:hypothetical protein